MSFINLLDLDNWKIFDPTLWERYGLAGLFGLSLVFLLLYVLRSLVPQMFTAFREELSKERENNKFEVALERAYCENNNRLQLEKIDKVQLTNQEEHEATRTHVTKTFQYFVIPLMSARDNNETKVNG